MIETVREVVEDYREVKVSGVKRELKIPIPSLPKAIALIGPRRAGKTFYLLQMYKDLLSQGKPALYIPLDDDRLYPPNTKTLSTLLDLFHMEFGEKSGILLLDEIQEVNRWELFVKRAVSMGFTVFISGSSSKLLSREVATQLRGRGIHFELFPFSFNEFINAKGVEPGASTKKRAAIKKTMEEYLLWGGFPEVALEENRLIKRKLLEEYLGVMLYRDIVERHGVKNLRALKLFIKLLTGSFAREISLSRTAKYMKGIGVDVSRNTLSDYLRYLQDAFFVFPLKKLGPIKESEKSLPKIYIIDNGIITASTPRAKSELGRLMENLTYLHLRRLEKEVYYIKTPTWEVDFAVREGNGFNLIQVSYTVEGPDTWKREVNGLIKASKLVPTKSTTVVTYDYEEEETIEGQKIRFVPLWKFCRGEIKL